MVVNEAGISRYAEFAGFITSATAIYGDFRFRGKSIGDDVYGTPDSRRAKKCTSGSPLYLNLLYAA